MFEIKWTENFYGRSLLLIQHRWRSISDTWHCPLCLRHLLSPKREERSHHKLWDFISQAHTCWGIRPQNRHKSTQVGQQLDPRSPVLCPGNFPETGPMLQNLIHIGVWRSGAAESCSTQSSLETKPTLDNQVCGVFSPKSKRTRERLGGMAKHGRSPERLGQQYELPIQENGSWVGIQLRLTGSLSP